jgi:hypothetical protein
VATVAKLIYSVGSIISDSGSFYRLFTVFLPCSSVMGSGEKYLPRLLRCSVLSPPLSPHILSLSPNAGTRRRRCPALRSASASFLRPPPPRGTALSLSPSLLTRAGQRRRPWWPGLHTPRVWHGRADGDPHRVLRRRGGARALRPPR